MDNPIRLHWLDPRNPRQPFPSAQLALRDPNGLLAIGGDLSVTRLIRAYSQGIFPWFNPDEPILWWCPDPRAILVPTEFHASRNLRRRLRADDYAVSLNRAFDDVLHSCGAPRLRSRGTWLGPEMKAAYAELHRHGFCQSVEVWRHGKLIGGLYGVSIGRAFFGESMFSRADDGSKIALYWLCRQLAAWRFEMIDCQISSAHLLSLGAVEWPRDRFLARLAQAVESGGRTGVWRFDLDVPGGREHLPAP
ncbi:MAG: leucyl/phenylalanyl-tRNA--protein transferase [Gammaproteobacteria bacterium]|nr:leucyl/phenylalanyl-tRNA--protein transferase [Gammaproteobacteria bacterium]